MGASQQLIPVELIANKIYLIRGQKIMLDRDLAELYGIPTFRFNEAVKRNLKRFPDDFMFQLTDDELNPGREKSLYFFISSPPARGRGLR